MKRKNVAAPLGWRICNQLGDEVGKVFWKGGRDAVIAAFEKLARVLLREIEPLLEHPDAGAELLAYFADLPAISGGKFRAEPIAPKDVIAMLDGTEQGTRVLAFRREAERTLFDDSPPRWEHNALPPDLSPVALLQQTRSGRLVWEPKGTLGRPIYHAKEGAGGTPATVSLGSPEPGAYTLFVERGILGKREPIRQRDTPAGRCVLGALWDILENGSDI